MLIRCKIRCKCRMFSQKLDIPSMQLIFFSREIRVGDYNVSTYYICYCLRRFTMSIWCLAHKWNSKQLLSINLTTFCPWILRNDCHLPILHEKQKLCMSCYRLIFYENLSPKTKYVVVVFDFRMYWLKVLGF